MTETAPTPDRQQKWVRWVARIWSGPIILFVLYFALGSIWSSLTNASADPYAVERATLLESLILLFFAISALGLALAWRWEKFGGIFSLVCIAGVYLTLLVQAFTTGEFSRMMIPSVMTLFVLIPGILFLISGTHANRSNPY
jgi:hypothetical protein